MTKNFMKSVELEQADTEGTPLEQRMARTAPGQLTWAEPKLNATCFDCKHFTTNEDEVHRSLPDGKGICKACYVHGQKKPKPYRGAAIACPQLERWK